MYETLKAISYPFANLSAQNLPTGIYTLINNCIVDFKLQVHSDTALLAHPKVAVTLLAGQTTPSSALRLGLTVTHGFENTVIASTGPNGLSFAPTAGTLVRYHFDSADFVASGGSVVSGVYLEGMLTTEGLSNLVSGLAAETSPFVFTSLTLEPATVSAFSLHKVKSLRFRSAKPLMTQVDGNRYQAETATISGQVKLVAGDNCSISVQEISNSIVLSPQILINGSQTERCGSWGAAVSSKDVLCGDVIYSISGAVPDERGNVRVLADSPLSVNTLNRQTFQELAPAFSSPLATVPIEVNSIIYVALPAGPNNASVFNCEGTSNG
jgi:hypothetical protein